MATTLQGLLPSIDAARGQLTTLGMRLYRVFVRVRTWASGEVGNGSFTDSDSELLPRPRVRQQHSDDEALVQALTSGGLRVEGELRIDRISAQIDISVLQPTLAAGQKLFFVVQGADGGEIAAQLYVLKKGPFRKTTEWAIEVAKAEG